MRVALLAQSYPPMVSGAALVVARLAQGLAARGHSVLVVAASDRGTAYEETNGALAVARLQAWPNPLRRGQHFLLWPQKPLAQTLRAFNPDVIHSHDPLIMSLAGLQAARHLQRPIPWVLTVHQLPWFVALLAPPVFQRPIEAGLWNYGRWLYQRFAAIVTPSQMIAELVAAHTASRPIVISNGVDTQHFIPVAPPGEADRLREKYGLTPSLPIVLYAGRLDMDKRVERVLAAAAKAQKHVPLQVLIVGDGTQRNHLQALAQKLGIETVCRFTGFVPASGDLAGLFRLAQVFMTAAEVEIQSSVVLEAMASGLPVVAVQASSMPELVVEGQTGSLAPAGDAETIVIGLAERLQKLLRDPSTAQRWGQAGRQLAERHSQVAMLEGYEHLYTRIGQSWAP